MIKILKRSDEPFSSNHQATQPVSTWPSFNRPLRFRPRYGNHGHRQRCRYCQRPPFRHAKTCTRLHAVPSDS